MSLKKDKGLRVRGRLPRFPKGIETLTRAFSNGEVLEIRDLKTVVNRLQGFQFLEQDRGLSDRSDWFAIAYYHVGQGQVAVGFPWCDDLESKNRSETDRCCGLYPTPSVTEEELEQLCRDLIKAFREFDKQIRREIRE